MKNYLECEKNILKKKIGKKKKERMIVCFAKKNNFSINKEAELLESIGEKLYKLGSKVKSEIL